MALNIQDKKLRASEKERILYFFVKKKLSIKIEKNTIYFLTYMHNN